MADRSGDFYAQVHCPSCQGSGKRWLVACVRCQGSGTVIARCVRCSCQALIGCLNAQTGEDIFKTEGVDEPQSNGGDCPSCRRLPYEPSLSRGHLRYDPPAERNAPH